MDEEKYDESYVSLDLCGDDPKKLSYRAAILIYNTIMDLGPLGPMHPFRMAEVIYHEVVLKLKNDQ